MRTISLFIVVASLAYAYKAPQGHKYIAPGPGDVRSPCPGLNSLANHGFLNRNGKNMTLAQLITGGADGLNIGADFMTAIGTLALFSPANPNGISFDLNDLGEHNFPIEHDASLSRQDYYYNHDDLDFYRPNYQEFISYFKGQKIATLQQNALARYSRVNASLTNNPNVTYGPEAFLFSYGESGLFTQTMGMSPTAVQAPVAFIKSLFVPQRLPYELGWQKPALPVTLASLSVYVNQLYGATNEKLPLGLEVITDGTYAQFLADYAATVGKIYNETHGGGS